MLAPRVECTLVASKICTQSDIAREQFIRHQTVERTQARSEDFHTRVVRALLHTRVFMKFKSSCTIHTYILKLLIDFKH